jgi:hypothetical protein
MIQRFSAAREFCVAFVAKGRQTLLEILAPAG